MFSGWCLAERCIGTLHIDNVTPKECSRGPFSPMPKSHLAWTRRLLHNQIRSLRQDTAILVVWEKGRIALDE